MWRVGKGEKCVVVDFYESKNVTVELGKVIGYVEVQAGVRVESWKKAIQKNEIVSVCRQQRSVLLSGTCPSEERILESTAPPCVK